jgi:hypothetical protein
MPKAIIAVVQTIYAAITLYRTKGNQVQVYGYAAFGFTVTPYIVMSIVNLIAQVVTPDYPALFLVRSDVMNEAERRGGMFDGVVGRLAEDELVKPDPRCYVGVVRTTNSSPQTYHIAPYDPAGGEPTPRNEDSSEKNRTCALVASLYRPKRGTLEGHAETIKEWVFIPSCTKFRRTRLILDDTTSAPSNSTDYFIPPDLANYADGDPGDDYRSRDQTKKGPWKSISFWISLTLSYVSIIVLSLLSSFHKGQSTLAQRCWTMSWLVVGIALALLSTWFRWLLVDYLPGYVYQVREVLRLGTLNGLILAFLGSGLMFLSFLAMGGIFFVPAVGGLVTVGKMLQEYGSCVSVS